MRSINKYVLILLLSFISIHASAQYLTKSEALEDFMQFKTLMENESSYYQLSDFNFTKRYGEIEQAIKLKDTVPIYFLANEFEKIIAETIDRHASIRMAKSDVDKSSLTNRYFPLILSYLNGKVVGLESGIKEGNYTYYLKNYPFIKSIDGIATDEFLNQYAHRSKRSPTPAKQSDGLRDVGDFSNLYFKYGKPNTNQVSLTFTNGKHNKTITLPLSAARSRWLDRGSLRVNENYNGFGSAANFDFNKLDKWLTDSIAYVAIPAMISYNSNPNFESYLHKTIKKFEGATALIIDIRGNGGGTRHILNTLSGYFVQPAESPWVANVAYIRSDQQLDEDIFSMKSRFLYNYKSQSLSESDRKAIDIFNKEFKTEHAVNFDKFSQPFYMVLRSNRKPLTCPIYILVNEESFSAASVFTSAFKGLPNVYITGINTNGSSGRSVVFYLKRSNIRVRLSTMLSFQRNGKTLDGNGTEPDIVIERDESQVFGKNDSQLEQLIEYIEND